MSDNKDILLINRDKYFLKQTASVLKEAGHTVHTAMEMRGALSVLSEHPIGLIVCDKALQDITGHDFLSFIKKDPLREKIPFMFFVSLNDQDRPLRSFQLGAIDYLVYPIDPQALVARIGEAFGAAPADIETTSPQTVPQAARTSVESPADQPAKKTPEDVIKTSLLIDVSRDGVIWMPGKITTLSPKSLSVETALFAKTGVGVMLRLKKQDDTFVINGSITEIAFDDFQKPAELEVAFESNDDWQRIHEVVKLSLEMSPNTPPETATPETVTEDGEPVDHAGEENPEISLTTLLKRKEKKPTYDLRFYQSLIGKQLDNYRAITFIGAGNMGGVLQGWDVALEREVALKIISYDLSSKEKFRKMFIKEARVVSRMNHPNIAHIYHIGSCNDILYYAMEFIEGMTLKDVIKDDGRIDPIRGHDYMVTICGAMETVYQNSIVHRDLKPANIMITRDGNLKIVDFGVAKNVDLKEQGTKRKNIIGSPWYMSPEQIAGLRIDHRSDMYSLGATFFHALSGKPPFHSDKIKDILRQHLKNPTPSLSEKIPEISPEYSQIIEKMMAKDPKHRYDRFGDIIDALNRLRPSLTS
jgi:DNA-binding response OmpR family regulator/predicted Ser/Thr protein kinase